MSWTIIAQTSNERPPLHKYNITAYRSGTAGAIKSEFEIDKEAIINDFRELLPFISGIRFRSLQKLELSDDPVQLVSSIKKRMRLALGDDINSAIDSAESIHIITDDLEIPWEMIGKDNETYDLRYPLGISALSKRRFLANRFNNLHSTNILFIIDTKSNLPQTRSEIQNIIRDFEERNTNTISEVNYVILKGNDATYSNVRRLLLQQYFDIIHVAAHTEPEGVLLNDGILSPEDIHTDTSMGAPWLVFMNSCESGIIKGLEVYEKFGELSNLSIAFLSAGVSSYIGTSCIINDASASQFASYFYNQLFQGSSVGQSLLKAKKDFIENYQDDDDLSWMAFRLYGDPNSRLYGDHNRDSNSTKKDGGGGDFRSDNEAKVRRYLKRIRDQKAQFDIIRCAKDLGISISEIRAIVSRINSQSF
jgi:CHAT domain